MNSRSRGTSTSSKITKASCSSKRLDSGWSKRLPAVETLSRQTGLSRDDLLEGLSRQLPEVINHLTPNGKLPSESDLSRWL